MTSGQSMVCIVLYDGFRIIRSCVRVLPTSAITKRIFLSRSRSLDSPSQCISLQPKLGKIWKWPRVHRTLWLSENSQRIDLCEWTSTLNFMVCYRKVSKLTNEKDQLSKEMSNCQQRLKSSELDHLRASELQKKQQEEAVSLKEQGVHVL